jgi:hypothetical protein
MASAGQQTVVRDDSIPLGPCEGWMIRIRDA